MLFSFKIISFVSVACLETSYLQAKCMATIKKQHLHFFWHVLILLISLRYTEIANNFQKEETVLNIDFVLLDNSPLKFALLSHCNEWQNKFTTLLREMGSQKLLELHNFLKDNAKK